MKRIVVFLAMALMAFSVAQAESEQDSTFVFGPADTETAAPELTPSPTPASTPIPADSGDSGFDFSQVDNPLATPVAVNPIDMPTPTPTPAPNYAYETYKNDSMGISFDIPYTWLLNPATNQETTVQFVEPKSERMEVDGYQTRLTVEKFSAGLSQTASRPVKSPPRASAAQTAITAIIRPPTTTARRITACAAVWSSSRTTRICFRFA